MSEYEKLMDYRDLYVYIAHLYACTGEKKLAQFYYNVACGYKIKAEKLTIAQVS